MSNPPPFSDSSPNDPASIRRRARRSRAWVAVTAGVSEPTAKLFELDPVNGVTDDGKRAALARVYRDLAAAQAPQPSDPKSAA